MEMEIKLLRQSAVPSYKTDGAAGIDLAACIEESMSLSPMERKMVPTGVCVAIPKGNVGLVFARSGLATRYGITLTNCVGVIDSDYRGEIMCSLINLGGETYTINPGDRIAQLVIMPAPQVAIQVTDKLSETERGEGGFGSTGR